MPVNFDFGKEWNKIKHFLEEPQAEKIIRKTYKEWQRGQILVRRSMGIDFRKGKYDPNKHPSQQLTTCDWWCEISDLICKTHKTAEDSQEIMDIKNNWDEDCEDIHWNKIWKIQDEVIKRAGYDWPKHKDKLAFYIPIGSCHTWNAIFGLWLARKVFPDLEWRVLTSQEHTTVYCKERDMIFDILYWSLDNRIEDHIVGKPYSSKDLTLGGDLALESASQNQV